MEEEMQQEREWKQVFCFQYLIESKVKFFLLKLLSYYFNFLFPLFVLHSYLKQGSLEHQGN